MSYRLTKTNGELLLELADGDVDESTTDITLIGRNYRGFGKVLNENFIHILENFAGTAPPNAPLTGQFWYDTNEQRMKVYDGSSFRSANGSVVSPTQPSLVSGDIWVDNRNNKLYFFDGEDLVLVGPEFDEGQGKSGFDVRSVIDETARERVILQLWLGDSLIGVFSSSQFRLSGSNKIDGFPDDENDPKGLPRQLIQPGFNPVEINFWYRGTATAARNLVDADNNIKTTENFIPSDEDGFTSGTLSIKNSLGLDVSVNDTEFLNLKVLGTTSVLETQQPGTNLALRTRFQNQFLNSLLIDSDEQNVGIYKDNPSYTLDVNGDFKVASNAVIDGNLTVNGDTTYINISELTIEDKNIELGLVNGENPGNDSDVDNAGIIVRSTNGDKKLTWINSTSSWTSNQDFNLTQGFAYKIDNQKVLDFGELGSTVTKATGLKNIGTLNDLKVDDIEIDDNTISTSLNELKITSSDVVNFNFTRATKLSDPVNDQDAVTKSWVESRTGDIIPLVLDTTGLSNPQPSNPYLDVADILEQINPANTENDGTFSRIHCVNYGDTEVSGIDVSSGVDKSFVEVETTSGNDESVLRDIAFSSVSGTLSFAPSRQTMVFEVQDGAWVWQSTI